MDGGIIEPDAIADPGKGVLGALLDAYHMVVSSISGLCNDAAAFHSFKEECEHESGFYISLKDIQVAAINLTLDA